MGRRANLIPLPDATALRKKLQYDKDTGKIKWRIPPNCFRAEDRWREAGTISKRGYRVIRIGNHGFYAHRLIWKIVTGHDPIDQIDHVNGDRSNNSWANLREATNIQNRYNARKPRNNASGVKGVCWDSSHKAWLAFIKHNSKLTKIGRFQAFDDAVAARRSAAAQLHGVFARDA